MDFSNWTRADFLAFDARRQETMMPTAQETADAEARAVSEKSARVASKLSALGIVMPETVTEDFCVSLLEAMEAKKFVGEDVRGWVNNQAILFGSLDKALDDLVDRYL